MKAIALAVNPMSGTDIRRLMSQANVSSNNDKIAMAMRIITAAATLGAKEFYLMPDANGLSAAIAHQLLPYGIEASVLEMPYWGATRDTLEFVRRVKERNVGCLVTIGGDGTARIVSKELGNLPLLPISAGTNNVYPYHTEGTAAGLAAAGVASGLLDLEEACIHDKVIQIAVNGVPADIALVDAVITNVPLLGMKGIRLEEMYAVAVTRCHPASIGFSSIVGCRTIVSDTDPFGAVMQLQTGSSFIAPLSCGLISQMQSNEPLQLSLGQVWQWQAPFDGSVALDGEREIMFLKNDTLTFRIVQEGPLRVNYYNTCALLQKHGLFLR